jgi:hypothetical protein
MAFRRAQSVHGFPFGMVNASDGSPIVSGTVVGYYVLDGGGQAELSDTAVHEGNGQWTINITAAEMDGDMVGLVFTHPSAVNTSFTIRTVPYERAGGRWL